MTNGLMFPVSGDFFHLSWAILGTVFLCLAIYYLINIGNQYIERRRRINIDLKFVAKCVAFLVVIYFAAAILHRYPIIGNTLGAMAISVIIAYVMNPLVSSLEAKGLKRHYGVLLVYVVTAVIFALLAVVVLPRTVTELRNLFAAIPSYVKVWSTEVEKALASFGSRTNLRVDPIIDAINASLNKVLEHVQLQSGQQLRSIASGITNLLSKLVSFVLILIFSFYFCADKERFRGLLLRSLPKTYKSDILYLASKMDMSLQEFVKGKLLLALFVGFGTTIMLLILRVDFAFVIGVITCIADIIPYIGPFLGLLPAVIFAAIDSKMKAFWVLIFFLFLQWAENNLMAPKILGNRTGMHPLLILLCIVIGGGMFGVGGMILSVPFVSILLILKDFFIMKYRENRARHKVH